VDGIVLFGTTGEGASFSVAERTGGLDALLDSDFPPHRLVAATGCAALADTVALTRHALQTGCPRCLVMPPFFWKGLSDEAVFRYYAALIDTVGDARLRLYEGAHDVRRPPRSRRAGCFVEVCSSIAGGDKTLGNRTGVQSLW